MKPARKGHAGINELPDDALVSIFERLELVERHRRLPLVCTRWARLVCSPVLLRSAAFDWFLKPEEQGLARMQSWCTQIIQRGRSGIEQLRFSVSLPDIDAALSKSAAEQLAAALAAAASGGRLTHLYLKASLPLDGGVLPALATLQRMHLHVLTGSAAAPPSWFCRLGQLTRLQRLALSAGWEGASGTALPQSLTCLQLAYEKEVGSVLEQQVPLLPRLRRFKYSFCDYLADGAALAALTRVAGTLKELEVVWSELPACLSALTGLEEIKVSCHPDNEDEGAVEALEAALPHLQRLTCLDFEYLPRLPATITSLPRLADLSLLCVWGELPPGSWLPSLRSLAVRGHTLGLAQLATSKLERLLVTYRGSDREEDEEFVETLAWAAKQQSLRHLEMIARRFIPLKACEVLLAMQRQRTDLHIQFQTLNMA